MKHLAPFAMLLTALPAPALAWGNEGHKVIALIAQTLLTPAALAGTRELLAQDKDTLTGSDFPSRATWADAYRNNHKETAGWHFVNLELVNPSMARACDTSRSCIVTKLAHFAAELRDPETAQPERLLAFKMILHLVGDIHQPLHTSDSHDGGGNCEQVTVPGTLFGALWGSSMSLHAYWDDATVAAIDTNPNRAAAELRKEITPALARQWSQGGPAQWAWESYGVARSVAYRFGGNPDCQGGSTALSHSYQVAAEHATRIQLERAGVRLAGILNGALAHHRVTEPE